MARLKRTAITGFLWQGLGVIGQRGALLLASIVLARFLTQSDFGIVAIAMGIVYFLELLRVGGVMQAFIAYTGEDERAAADATFWLCFLPGVLWTVALAVSAPFLGEIFAEPKLTPVLLALSITQLIDSFRIVPSSLLLRHSRFRERAISESIPVIVGVVCAVGSLAFLPEDGRLWSLVIMWLTRYVLMSVMSLWFSPFFPKFALDRTIMRSLTRRGFGILLSNIPSGTLESLNVAIIGKRTSAATAGVFRMAWNVGVPGSVIMHAANWTLYPLLAQEASKSDRLRDLLVRSTRSVTLLSAGLMCWLIVTAPDLVPILLGQDWAAAVLPTQWLGFAMLIRVPGFVCTTTLLAAGKAMHASLIWWTTLVVGVALLFLWPFSVDDAVTPSVLTAVTYSLFAVLSLLATSSALSVSMLSLLVSLWPSVVCCGLPAVAAGLCYLAPVAPSMRLALTTVVYAVLFLSICGRLMSDGWLALFRPSGWRQMLRST